MASSRNSRQQTVSVRVSAVEKTLFTAMSIEKGGTSHVMRELLLAYIEHRVTVIPRVTINPYHEGQLSINP